MFAKIEDTTPTLLRGLRLRTMVCEKVEGGSGSIKYNLGGAFCVLLKVPDFQGGSK